MRILLFLLFGWASASAFSFAASVTLPSGEMMEAPDSLLLNSITGIYEEVRFDHVLHDSYASCVECHHHLTGKPSAEPGCNYCHRFGTSASPIDCKSCHLVDRFSEESLSGQRNQTNYHIDIAGLIGAYHLQCVGCHLSITAGPTGCQDCHRKKENSVSP